MWPRGEENVRYYPLRSKAVLSDLAGADAPLGRRGFLTLGAVLTGGLALGRKPALADPAQASPPADAPWSQSIGAGVVDRPYGRPADTEASVIRRNVPWLTASAESSVSFSPLQDLHGTITPNGLFFERHHAGRPDVDGGPKAGRVGVPQQVIWQWNALKHSANDLPTEYAEGAPTRHIVRCAHDVPPSPAASRGRDNK